ncbi:MAG: acetyltransferase component of pyruvate dehydrogenase complex [marine bacterium B5-7]|nr:MAG: acetyltransferase component of pyruvate dehydrogenase complex [marine bacterium B5-7]
MSVQQIHVPDIGDFSSVEIIEILVNPGDSVAIDDALITLESDKASMDVPSPEAGVIKEIKVAVGDSVSEGDLIVILESEGEVTGVADNDAAVNSAPSNDQSEAADSGGSSETPAAASVAPSANPAVSFERVHASPSMRRIAREMDIDLNRIVGSGRKGRITRSDIESFVKGGTGKSASASSKATAPAGSHGIEPIPSQDFSKFGDTELLPLNKIKRLTGANLSRAWLNVPHVTHHDEADITNLEAFRKELKPRAEKAGVRVTLLAFVMKALADSLKTFPTFNSSLDETGENLILKKYVNIGIAVDTPNGLVVPVIRDVDRKGIFELSADLMEMSGKARDKKLKTADMTGGSMTISSLGGIGGTAFTPIVNAPEVAILGLTRSKEQPFRGTDDGIVWRLMQPLSISYDHRVIDGAEAARFTRHLADLLGDIRLLLA